MEILTTALEYPNHASLKSKIVPPCSAQTSWIVLHRVRYGGLIAHPLWGVRRPWFEVSSYSSYAVLIASFSIFITLTCVLRVLVWPVSTVQLEFLIVSHIISRQTWLHISFDRLPEFAMCSVYSGFPFRTDQWISAIQFVWQACQQFHYLPY